MMSVYQYLSCHCRDVDAPCLSDKTLFRCEAEVVYLFSRKNQVLMSPRLILMILLSCTSELKRRFMSAMSVGRYQGLFR